MVCVECKNGPSAKLTPNQKQASVEFPDEGAIPRGKNTEQAGLTVGEKTGPIEFEVRRVDAENIR